jgi:hypothetical protein
MGLGWFVLGMAARIPHDAWHSLVWSAECLPGRFGASSISSNGGGDSSPPILSV